MDARSDIVLRSLDAADGYDVFSILRGVASLELVGIEDDLDAVNKSGFAFAE